MKSMSEGEFRRRVDQCCVDALGASDLRVGFDMEAGQGALPLDAVMMTGEDTDRASDEIAEIIKGGGCVVIDTFGDGAGI